MIFKEETIKALQAPLNKKHVAQRSQGGKNLSYIEAWHAIAEANRIFGHGSWEREMMNLKCIDEGAFTTKNGKEMQRAGYIATVRITVLNEGGAERIVREGTGFGSGMAPTPGEAHEGAVKEAESDAMKRALMTFGWPFGLALYDKQQENVAEEGAVDALMKAGDLMVELQAGVTEERKEEIKAEVKAVWRHINDDTKEKFKEYLTK